LTTRNNAAAESFFAALKNEMYYCHSFPTQPRARFAVAEYIEVFYNNDPRLPHPLRGPHRLAHRSGRLTNNHEDLSKILDTAQISTVPRCMGVPGPTRQRNDRSSDANRSATKRHPVHGGL
jgi:Integrase core domain